MWIFFSTLVWCMRISTLESETTEIACVAITEERNKINLNLYRFRRGGIVKPGVSVIVLYLSCECCKCETVTDRSRPAFFRSAWCMIFSRLSIATKKVPSIWCRRNFGWSFLCFRPALKALDNGINRHEIIVSLTRLMQREKKVLRLTFTSFLWAYRISNSIWIL